MLTERDLRITGWIGGLGAAGGEHVVTRFATGRSLAFKRLALLVGAGMLEQRRLLYGRPALYVATRAGLRAHGLEGLGAFRLGPGGFEHAWRVAEVAARVGAELADWEVLGEREFRWRERDAGELLASIKLPPPGGSGRLHDVHHRPDLALVSPAGRVVAVEVELTVKSRRRLELICRGWNRARHVEHTYYLATPAAAAAVGRAVKATRTQELVTVLALDRVGEVVERERGGMEAVAGCIEEGGHLGTIDVPGQADLETRIGSVVVCRAPEWDGPHC